MRSVEILRTVANFLSPTSLHGIDLRYVRLDFSRKGKLDLTSYLLNCPTESFYISSITLSKLWHGCHRATAGTLQNRLKSVQEIESMMPVLPFGEEEARIHAEIWAMLKKKRQPFGLHDLIIGATRAY